MSAIKEVEVRSLGELIEHATPTVLDPASGRLRDYAVYRGAADANWPLLSSLDRLGGVTPPGTKLHLENDIFRNFLRYAHAYLPPNLSNKWELLIIAQHHGLPTRLLDWTYSPLVAAHFATLEESAAARAVWKLDWTTMHDEFSIRKRALLVDELEEELGNRNSGFTDMMKGSGLGGSGFAALIDPPAIDSRIVVQSSTFTFCTERGVTLDKFLIAKGLEGFLTKFVLPVDRVSHLRDQLDLCSVDERRLFPDLDGVAAEMRRYYS